MTDHPGLHRLIGAYANDDWGYFYPDVWAAVDDFVSGSPSSAELLPAEIGSVLREFDDEDELERYLDRLGLGYIADPNAGGYRGWLQEVSRRVEARLTTPREGSP